MKRGANDKRPDHLSYKIPSDASDQVRAFHEVGFAKVDKALTKEQVQAAYEAVADRFEELMRTVTTLDLTEKLQRVGFVEFKTRSHNRYDMTLPSLTRMKFLTTKAPWMNDVKSILGKNAKLVHHGCMLSLPNSVTQPWHSDGPHLSKHKHLKPHIMNVFVPLVDLTTSNGPTEFVPRSHIDWYSKSRPVAPRVRAGGYVMMDYRIKHRGKGNSSTKARPLLYLTYSKPGHEDKANFSGRRYARLPKIAPKTTRAERAARRAKRKIPKHYVGGLSKSDERRQARAIEHSRAEYEEGRYADRPKLKSFKGKESKHVKKARELYGVKSATPRELSAPTKCSKSSLEKIVKKGRGAFYSSGSRPNQTPSSWAYARLASAVTGGKSACVDLSELKAGCSSDSKALKLALDKCAPLTGGDAGRLDRLSKEQRDELEGIIRANPSLMLYLADRFPFPETVEGAWYNGLPKLPYQAFFTMEDARAIEDMVTRGERKDNIVDLVGPHAVINDITTIPRGPSRSEIARTKGKNSFEYKFYREKILYFQYDTHGSTRPANYTGIESLSVDSIPSGSIPERPSFYERWFSNPFSRMSIAAVEFFQRPSTAASGNRRIIANAHLLSKLKNIIKQKPAPPKRPSRLNRLSKEERKEFDVLLRDESTLIEALAGSTFPKWMRNKATSRRSNNDFSDDEYEYRHQLLRISQLDLKMKDILFIRNAARNDHLENATIDLIPPQAYSYVEPMRGYPDYFEHELFGRWEYDMYYNPYEATNENTDVSALTGSGSDSWLILNPDLLQHAKNLLQTHRLNRSERSELLQLLNDNPDLSRDLLPLDVVLTNDDYEFTELNLIGPKKVNGSYVITRFDKGLRPIDVGFDQTWFAEQSADERLRKDGGLWLVENHALLNYMRDYAARGGAPLTGGRVKRKQSAKLAPSKRLMRLTKKKRAELEAIIQRNPSLMSYLAERFPFDESVHDAWFEGVQQLPDEAYLRMDDIRAIESMVKRGRRKNNIMDLVGPQAYNSVEVERLRVPASPPSVVDKFYEYSSPFDTRKGLAVTGSGANEWVIANEMLLNHLKEAIKLKPVAPPKATLKLPAEVMKYTELTEEEMDSEELNFAGWFMSEKRDGWHIIWDGKSKLLTKNKSKTLAAPISWLKLLPQGVALSGEVVVEGGNFSDTARLVKPSGPWKRAKFIVFDVLNPEDRSKPFAERLERLARVVNESCRAEPRCPLVLAEQIKLPNGSRSRMDIAEFYGKVKARGGEGVVLTDPSSVYEEGPKRSKRRVKIKVMNDAEAVVTGHNIKKEDGTLKSLNVAFEPEGADKRVHFRLGTGFTAEERKSWARHFPVGTVVTFKFMKLNPGSMKPRQPLYMRVREDTH